MKTKRLFFVVALVAAIGMTASAQQVNTVYYLENAPMRHTFNPAFQPVSEGFINFTPLGWSMFSVGNNSLTVSDAIYTAVDPVTGERSTITALHPNGDKQAFLRTLHNMTLFNGDFTLGLLNMGFRIKNDGYLTIGINERIEAGVTLPKHLFQFALGGGMTNLEPGAVNSFSLTGLGAGTTMYTEIGAGYSHKLNEHWTIGGKLKLLLGQAHIGANSKTLGIDASSESWHLRGNMHLEMAGPLNFADPNFPNLEGRTIGAAIDDLKGLSSEDWTRVIDYRNVGKLLKPSGAGAAIDFGFTYKPIENLQISAAINDLGFIYWINGYKYTASIDTIFDGVGEFEYNDFVDETGHFSTQMLLDSALTNLKGIADGATLHRTGNGYAKMVSARLNIGLDANFWDNRVGIGILSATRLYNARLYEEVTIGVSFRPVNWFSIAASYSLMNNGKYSNIGAGLSFMPYDGINMTLAMDYIPTTYAAIDVNGTPKYLLPTKAKMVNLALGFSICWGTNRKDSDKDGVWDKLDMCPDTPVGVEVDKDGCPVDEDEDGVPNHLDKCPGTPAEARSSVDSVGCPKDTDKDGVPDYLDKCPNTPEEARHTVDSVGCPKDSDSDGVPDYLDECPNTPENARHTVDEKGCPKDSDGDGVPDYLDECPNTPAEARNSIDNHGCPKDSDGDGIFDYLDECPYAAGPKENKGCPEVKREVRQLLQKAMQGIEFETGKATIKKKSYPLLNQIAAQFIANPSYVVEVQGHTDSTGKLEFNQLLSYQRANAVRDYLIGQGVNFEHLTAVGYGPSQPIADNNTAAGRQKNRRVEFKITFEDVHIETVLDHADPAPAE